MSSDLKNVVIIGAASAGGQLAHSLEKTLPKDHRLVVIEANEFVYWPIGGLRAAVLPGFEKEVFASLDNFFPADSRHVVLKGYEVKSISADRIQLNKPAPAPFNSDSIDVSIGVIASGSSYATPMRPASTKLDEAVAALRKAQKDVAEAKNIVILGGGPVGVEYAGEILAQHKDKKITLIERGPRLLAGWRQPLHDKLIGQMKAKNVDVRLNTSVELTEDLLKSQNVLLGSPQTITLSDGSQVQTDFLFVGTGGKPNVSAVPKEALSEPKQGQKASPHARIHVDPATLRVEYEPLNARWFSLGDASDVPDAKTHVATSAQVPIVASQVTAQATGSPAKKAKRYNGSPSVMAVPFGPSAGASQVMYPVLGEWVTSLLKSKHLFISSFAPTYPGGQPLKK